jgi:hypothetical protein
MEQLMGLLASENIQYSKWLYSVDYADSVNWIISGFDGVILKNTVGSTYILLN